MSQETCLYLRAPTLTQLYLMNRNLFQPFDWPLTNGFCTISWIHLTTDIYTAKEKSTLWPLI